jgi:hypothetical protein
MKENERSKDPTRENNFIKCSDRNKSLYKSKFSIDRMIAK